jgi:hypothetical protein
MAAQRMRILDLVDPAHPRDVGAYTLRYVHDGFVRNDISRHPSSARTGDRRPATRHTRRVSFTVYVSPTRTTPTNRDGTILFTTDETTRGHLRIWDVIDPRDVPGGGVVGAPRHRFNVIAR